MLLSRILRVFGLAHLVLGALVATVIVTDSSARRYGDNLQIALPLLAWGCAATKAGDGKEFALRFAAMFAAAHASKTVLGDAPLNQRPNGHDGGFPSAHTAAAALGASGLVHGCLKGNPAAQAVVVIAAAFVGGSRIEVGAHDIWQVLAGALLGWVCDRALRHGPGRAQAAAAIAALRRRIGPLLSVRAPALPRAALVTSLVLAGLAVLPALG